jgi:hypothetical protein
MSILKTSKVVNIQGNGTFETQHGLFYNYDIQLENGDSGEYASKNYTSVDALPFTKGGEIDYEFHAHDKFPKIKRPTIAGAKRFDPNQSFKSSSSRNNDPDVQLMIVRQSSMQRSVEILTHNNSKVKLNDVITLADKLSDWVMSGTKFDSFPTNENVQSPEPVPMNMHHNVPTPKSEPVKTQLTQDDLPF